MSKETTCNLRRAFIRNLSRCCDKVILFLIGTLSIRTAVDTSSNHYQVRIIKTNNNESKKAQ